MSTREEIADWIDGQIRAKEAPANKLTLARMSTNGAETHPMLQLRCTENDLAESLAERVHDKALAIVRGLRLEGVMFVLQSWNDAGPRESTTFRIAFDGDGELALGMPSTEVAPPSFPTSNPAAALGATIANVHGQALRHQEVMFRLTMQGMAQSQKTLLDQNRYLQEQNQILLRKHQQLLLLVERMHDRSNERALAVRSQEMSERRKDDILQLLTPLVPILMSRVLAAMGFEGAAPGGADPMLGELVRGLFATLKKEQVAQMMAPLSPEQAAAVIEILKRLSAQVEARQASVDRAVASHMRQENAV